MIPTREQDVLIIKYVSILVTVPIICKHACQTSVQEVDTQKENSNSETAASGSDYSVKLGVSNRMISKAKVELLRWPHSFRYLSGLVLKKWVQTLEFNFGPRQSSSGLFFMKYRLPSNNPNL